MAENIDVQETFIFTGGAGDRTAGVPGTYRSFRDVVISGVGPRGFDLVGQSGVSLKVFLRAKVQFGDTQKKYLALRKHIADRLALEVQMRAQAHATPDAFGYYRGRSLYGPGVPSGVSLEGIQGPGPHPHRKWEGWPSWVDTGKLAESIRAEPVTNNPDLYGVVVRSDMRDEQYNVDLEMGWTTPAGNFYRYQYMQPAVQETIFFSDLIISRAIDSGLKLHYGGKGR